MTEKKGSHFRPHPFRRRRGNTHELAEGLAPLEELLPAPDKKPASPVESSQLVAQEDGAIMVGLQKPALTEDIVDGQNGKQILGMDRVVIIIVGLFLAFIVFIAWQVSQMPVPK